MPARTSSKARTLLQGIIRGSEKHTIKANGHTATLYGVMIAPDKAREWLDVANLKNRAVRPYKVEEYRATMNRNGSEWRLENVIKATDAGILIDGQHRLLACADAETPQPFILQIIPAREAGKSNLATDEGVARNLADFLRFNDVPNSSRVAPLLVAERNARVTGNPFQKINTSKPDYLRLYHDIGEETIKKAIACSPKGMARRLQLRNAIIDWVALQLVQVDEGHAETFMTLVDNPATLRETDAPYVLHRRLLEFAAKRRPHQHHGALPPVAIATMFVKGWNHYFEGTPTDRYGIRYRVNENFPTIYGTEAMGNNA